MTIDDFNRMYPVRKVMPDTCWCGEANDQADDHRCPECPEHCELAAHREGRDSPRDAELRRQLVVQRRRPRMVPLGERRSA